MTFEGRSWRQEPEMRQQMFDVFPVMRQLHELLWYLSEAMEMPHVRSIRGDIVEAFTEAERLTGLDAQAILDVDVDAHRDRVDSVLSRVSELARAGAGGEAQVSRRIRPGADLIGAKLNGQDLRGANLRGAYLIAADLRHADLRSADLIGADLRDADLCGADLSESLFLTQVQLNSARGDATTKLPPSLTRPSQWIG